MSETHSEKSFFDNLETLVPQCKVVGEFLAASGMFGCTRTEQGAVLAMEMFITRKPPFQIRREYHLVAGKVVDRADSILAKFRQHGGRHIIKERSPARAAVTLTLEGRSTDFELKWTEIEHEPWVNDKDGKLKPNYAFPRARSKMLWWRLVADAIAALMPEIVAGMPPDEELTPDDQPTLTLAATAAAPAIPPAQAPAAVVPAKPPAPPAPAPPAPPAIVQAPAKPPQAPKANKLQPAEPGAPTARVDPATGLLDAPTVAALGAIITEPRFADAKAFCVLKGFLTEDQAQAPNWLELLPVKRANQVFKHSAMFLEAIQPGNALT